LLQGQPRCPFAPSSRKTRRLAAVQAETEPASGDLDHVVETSVIGLAHARPDSQAGASPAPPAPETRRERLELRPGDTVESLPERVQPCQRVREVSSTTTRRRAWLVSAAMKARGLRRCTTRDGTSRRRLARPRLPPPAAATDRDDCPAQPVAFSTRTAGAFVDVDCHRRTPGPTVEARGAGTGTDIEDRACSARASHAVDKKVRAVSVLRSACESQARAAAPTRFRVRQGFSGIATTRGPTPALEQLGGAHGRLRR